MHISLNGQALDLPHPMTIVLLLAHLGLGGKRVAVEVNRCIVPRSAHATHALQDGDTVELVQAMGGG